MIAEGKLASHVFSEFILDVTSNEQQLTAPEFDPSLKSFYYARLIEIPTPRWTAYYQVRFGVKMSDEVPMMLQERAYTSPIWYTP